MPEPARGEVWYVDLGPTRGREQAGRRPALVVSVDDFNTGPAGLVIVVPMTTRKREIPLHVEVDPPEGGVRETSYIKCEDVRAISKGRLIDCWGRVGRETMEGVEDRLRILLGL